MQSGTSTQDNLKQFHVPETTLYRKVNGELVVVQLETAHFYYFNPETETFLDFFQTPTSMETFMESANLKSSDELAEIREFFQSLLEKKILCTKDVKPTIEKTKSAVEVAQLRPKFLRDGEKTLDQIFFLCP